VTLSATWSCRVIPSLTHELNQTQSPALQWDQALPSPQVVLQQLTFPGVLLSAGVEVMAALGFTAEPDGTLAISEPWFFGSSSLDDQSLMFAKMLQAVHAEAERLDLRMIRMALHSLPNDESTDTTGKPQVLKRCGFTDRARIVHWKAAAAHINAACASESDSSDASSLHYHEVPLESRLKDVEESQSLSGLVQWILSETEDLPGMPAALAEPMITTWNDQKARILIGQTPSTAAGLIVWTVDTFSGAAPVPGLQIQYIGVRPELRQRGIGSRLLAEALRTDNQHPAVNSCDLQVTAFADQDNQPASSFYRRCGFAEESSMVLWCRDI